MHSYLLFLVNIDNKMCFNTVVMVNGYYLMNTVIIVNGYYGV